MQLLPSPPGVCPICATDHRPELRYRGKWTAPEEGEPIADPPAESIHQPVGDASSHGFGPAGE